MSTNRIVVFGSLRQNSKRGYNCHRCGEQLFVKPVTLSGYDMFDLGAYPAIAEGEGTIQAELHLVDDKTIARIRSMEAGAGYTEKIIDIDGLPATIFLMSPQILKEYGEIKKYESGDWN
jgi:gamma-glutamylcyclotransferase (GGCT)/AIG2-like uncharacterized protein YtfP